MKKIYGIAFVTLLLGANQTGCVVKKKTAYEIAASLSAALSPFMTKNALDELMAQAKMQSAENGVDEKEVVQSLIWKIDTKAYYYKNYLLKPTRLKFKDRFLDSNELLIFGTAGILLSSLIYYCRSEDEGGHFFDAQDVRIDKTTGRFFVSDNVLKVLAKNNRDRGEGFGFFVATSATAFVCGTYLKIWEWYAEAYCKKYSVIRTAIVQYMNTL